MKRAVLGALPLLLCAACGTDDGEPSSTASSQEPATSLRESCANVEAALPGGLVPPARRWRQYATELDAIAETGDTETKNALEGLQRAVDELAADPAAGLPLLDAREALHGALDNLAGRCKAVGSSALQ